MLAQFSRETLRFRGIEIPRDFHLRSLRTTLISPSGSNSSRLSAGIPPIPLLYIRQFVKLITRVPSSRPPVPLHPGARGPGHIPARIAFLGPSRALASRADRRNVANPNKTEAAVSANTCPRFSTKCEKCLSGPRSAKSARPISTDSFPPTRRPDRALSVSAVRNCYQAAA